MKYELLLFDADGTLFDYYKGEEFALQSALEKNNVIYKAEKHLPIYRKINHQIWEDFENGLITSEKLRIERFVKFFGKLGLKIDAAKFSGEYLGFLAQSTFLLENAVELIAHLDGKYKLALITNGLQEVQYSRFGKSQLDGYFPHIIISDEIGVAKPDPKIFEYAFQMIGHQDKKTAIIIGDNLNSDIRGGVNFGIDTCWFNPNGKENPTELEPTYEIKNLMELKNIVGI